MNLLKLIWGTYRIQLIPAVVAGLISGASSAGVIAMIHSALGQQIESTGRMAWYFIGLCSLSLISGIASKVLLVNLTQKAVFDLRMRLSRRILAASLRHLEELGPHRLLAALTDDVFAIAAGLSNLPLICINLSIIVSCLAYITWLSPSNLLVVLFFMTLGIITFQGPMVVALRLLKHGRSLQDTLFKHLRALVEGTKELKIHAPRRNMFVSQHLEGTAMALQERNFLGLSIYTAAGTWGELLILIFIGLLVFVLPHLRSINTAELTGYTLLALYLMLPIGNILYILPAMGRGKIALQKIDELGLSLTANCIEPLSTNGAVVPQFELLELVNICHSYRGEEEDQFSLGPMDIAFRRNEVVFITGGNGSGKTTLAKIITGLYTPESGVIRLNGEVITDSNREDLRQNFSVVFSDFYLFDSLVGLDSDDMDLKARDYLSQLHLETKVMVNDGAFSTIALSQGQRKRLALLTAYLEDRSIYLFDEWAADQDPHFKEIFYLKLLPELKERGKVVIVISHDDRYYHIADRVIRLEHGQVKSHLDLESSIAAGTRS